jgi:hypothetical protein
MRPLKPRQERFCRRFAEFGCATTAARAAGYAPGSAETQNNDFCFAGKLFYINDLSALHAYFCIPPEKPVSFIINCLDNKNAYFCVLLHTFPVRTDGFLWESTA